ncbi:hypothetical protein TNCV_1971931 [Trichonephila clavipes]|nr:hypothetical protein TNCV_1971931 [Trichonephila clavipes]
MSPIVSDNDESVREGYIKNGGKEVKVPTSVFKLLSAITDLLKNKERIWMFFLRGRIISRLECSRTHIEASEEELPKVWSLSSGNEIPR